MHHEVSNASEAQCTNTISQLFTTTPSLPFTPTHNCCLHTKQKGAHTNSRPQIWPFISLLLLVVWLGFSKTYGTTRSLNPV